MDVAGSDGKRIGQVKEIRDNDFLLERSMARDVYVPFAALTRVTMDRATLNVVGDSIDDLHWQSPSRPGEPDWSIPGSSSSSASGSSGSTSMTSATGASGAGTAGQTVGRPSTSTQPTTGQSAASQRQAATAGTASAASAATTGSGYRYGQAMASDPRYQGRRWEDVQSDLKSGYPTWARQQGAGSENDERAWEHLHEEVRRAWEESRR